MKKVRKLITEKCFLTSILKNHKKWGIDQEVTRRYLKRFYRIVLDDKTFQERYNKL